MKSFIENKYGFTAAESGDEVRTHHFKTWEEASDFMRNGDNLILIDFGQRGDKGLYYDRFSGGHYAVYCNRDEGGYIVKYQGRKSFEIIQEWELKKAL